MKGNLIVRGKERWWKYRPP